MAQPGLIFTLDDEQVKKRVRSILANLDDLTPAMEKIGEMAVTSIQRNFEESGRPNRWEDLADSTKAQRIKTSKWPGEILVISGELKKISYEASKKEVVMMPADVPYAAIHHFGFDGEINQSVGKHTRIIKQAFGKTLKSPKTVEVKAHQRTIHMEMPARAYMLLQDEDGIEINAILADFVMGEENYERMD